MSPIYGILNKLASRPIQSSSCNVRIKMCVLCMSPPLRTGTERAGASWSKSVLLILDNLEPLYFGAVQGFILF